VFIFRSYDSRHERANRTVPPRYDVRLEDLRAFHLVRAECQACGHKAIIPNATLQRNQPGHTRLTSLQRRLRCRRCGAKGKALLEMEFQPRD
jgi:DNA-directed RNA polymerase subunit RPC12/RpoP